MGTYDEAVEVQKLHLMQSDKHIMSDSAAQTLMEENNDYIAEVDQYEEIAPDTEPAPHIPGPAVGITIVNGDEATSGDEPTQAAVVRDKGGPDHPNQIELCEGCDRIAQHGGKNGTPHGVFVNG